MSDNRIVLRHSANIEMGKPTVAKVLDNDDYVDHQMLKNHERAVASQISTAYRLEGAQAVIGALAVTGDRFVKQLHGQVKSGTEGLDREDKQDFAVIDFGEQALATVSNIFLRQLNAAGEYLVNQAGKDIQDNIKTETPPEKPPTIIYQQPTAPKMRPAKIFEGGRTKYVIDE